MMEDTKKTNAVELDDDALENAAGGARGTTSGRGQSGRTTGSSVSEEERQSEQSSEN